MRRTLQRALVILVAGAALGLAGNAVSPRGIPLIAPPPPPLADADVLPLADAKQLWQSGAGFLLDARSPADYAAGHIANAVNLPAEQFDQFFPRVAPLLTPDTAVTVYCDGEKCDLSHEVLQKLRALGYHNARLLVNGWTAWRTAGWPTAMGAQP